MNCKKHPISLAILLAMALMGLTPQARGGGSINLVDYWFPGGNGSTWTYEYTNAPAGSLNFTNQPFFTVTQTLGNYGGYTNIYQIGDYLSPDGQPSRQYISISKNKRTIYSYGNADGFYSEPETLGAVWKVGNAVELISGNANTLNYLMTRTQITVPAGTFSGVLVQVSLDPAFQPNSGNYLLGINVPNAAVTHVTWTVKGVGKVMDVDVDAASGDIVSVYWLTSYQLK